MIFKKKEPNESDTFQTIKEEIANSITHGIGSILSIVALVVLLYSSITRGTARHVVSSSVYGGSLVMLYFNSTLYHAITHNFAKKVLRRLDHISIYLLIAGTFMPIALVVLKGALGWTVFGIECGLCLIGVVFKAVFGPRYNVLSLMFYLLMGGVAVLVFKPVYLALSLAGLLWLCLGGFFYILGIIFFVADKKFAYFHTIWHLFVLGGSVSHFILILLYVIPYSN